LPAESVLAVQGLVKRFGRQVALDRVTLDVHRGDVFGFLGLNGSGKTTTLRIALGLLRADAGQVALFGETSGAGRLAALARIGAMVEGPAFYEHLSGARNLALLGGLSGRLTHAEIADTLALVGLGAAGRKRARDYSLGMKQRLGIALALVSKPELVILDEPTNGLDPNGILEMRRLIQRLNRERGVTFLVSSHLLYEIEMICNRVAILEKGRILVQDDVATILAGMGGRYVLRTEDPTAAERVLTKIAGIELSERKNGAPELRFRTSTDHLPEINFRLAAERVRVATLAEERPSLEEYFLERSSTRAVGELS
jgi:ABC-type multidrug transport system ATPase subunit